MPDVSLYPNTTNSAEHIDKSNYQLFQNLPHGIDLRKHMAMIIRDYGHYVIIRQFDTTKRSIYWNDITKESVGGPAWVYTDHIVKARRTIVRSGGTLSALDMPTPIGLLTVEYCTYYFEWDCLDPDLTKEDELYEFKWTKNRKPTPEDLVSGAIVSTRKYNILEAIDMLGDNGRIEYWACVCKQDVLGY